MSKYGKHDENDDDERRGGYTVGDLLGFGAVVGAVVGVCAYVFGERERDRREAAPPPPPPFVVEDATTTDDAPRAGAGCN
jgi:hypothetical protein